MIAHRRGVIGMMLVLASLLGGAGSAPAQEGAQVPEEVRRQLQQELGPPFAIFRGKVQEELKLSDESRKKLDEALLERVQDAMQQFEALNGLKPEEREKTLGEYRNKVRAQLAEVVKNILSEEQLKRLRQILLQLEGAFALGTPDVGKELQITAEQRKQFMVVVQELQKKVQPLIQEARDGGDPTTIRPKVEALRKEHEGKLEALLTEAQRTKWNTLLGARFELGD